MKPTTIIIVVVLLFGIAWTLGLTRNFRTRMSLVGACPACGTALPNKEKMIHGKLVAAGVCPNCGNDEKRIK